MALCATQALRWIGAAVGLLGLSASIPAMAHPHVWVTVETTVLFEGGSISGFRHKWTFDEFYTSMAVQDLDTNKDGVYSREELAELAKVNIEGLKEFQFFTHVALGEQKLVIDDPKDYWLEHGNPPVDPDATKLPQQKMLPRASDVPKPGFFTRLWDLVFGSLATEPLDPGAGKVLSLHFTLPLKQPVLVDAPDFAFGVYDPSFFIALELSKTDPVKLGPGAPQSCSISLGDAEKTADDAQQLGEAFSQQLGSQNFGSLAAKPIKLNCGPRT